MSEHTIIRQSFEHNIISPRMYYLLMDIITSLAIHLQFTLKYNVIHFFIHKFTFHFKCLYFLELRQARCVFHCLHKQLQYTTYNSIEYVLWNICAAL